MKISETIQALVRMVEVGGVDAEVWLDCRQIERAVKPGLDGANPIVKLESDWLLVEGENTMKPELVPDGDGYRRTGRSTRQALQTIVSAMSNPGVRKEFIDHYGTVASNAEQKRIAEKLVRDTGLKGFSFGFGTTSNWVKYDGNPRT